MYIHSYENKILSVIGKTSKDGSTLPVVIHQNDCGVVAEFLYDKWLCDSIKNKFSKIKNIKEKFIFTCLVHDLGKFSTDFQNLILENKKNGKRHDILSRAYICEYLNIIQNTEVDNLPSIIEIIGYHHGRLHSIYGEETEDYDIDSSIKNIISKNELFSIIDFYLTNLNLTKNDIIETWDVYTNFIISGLVIVSDWIASNTNIFPLFTNNNNKSITENKLKQRYSNAIKKLNSLFPDIKAPSFQNAQSFYSHAFNINTPNELQNKTFNKTGDLFIIEAPTGCGKTEAALSIAYSMIANKKAKGIYMALPTCATSNALYNRFSDFVKKSFGKDNNIVLEHSKSKLFFDDKNLNYENEFNRKLTGINNFIIGTTDHVIRMPICLKHFTMFHAELANKVIIFDEVHCYDATMFEYLLKTLRFLKEYNTPVIILSATLPIENKSQILNVYNNNTSKLDILNKHKSEYPAITSIHNNDNNNIEIDTIPYQSKQTINLQLLQRQYIDAKDDSLDAKAIIKTINEKGRLGFYGIIANTISRTQNIYKHVSDAFGENNVILLHARLESSHRTTIENKILSILGKHKDNTNRYLNKEFIIIIGTQILEQSIDIDFDCLFTDLCPADCLVQRIGRLHRHQNNNKYRPIQLSKPQCFIMQAYVSDNLDKCISSYSKIIYSDYRLFITYANLLNITNIGLNNKNTYNFIQKSYDDNANNITLFNLSLDEYKQEYKDNIKTDKINAINNMLDNVPYSNNDLSLVHLYDSKDYINCERINPCVRKVLNSLEVVLLNYNTSSNLLEFCDGEENVSNDITDLTMLKHTIVLPNRIIHYGTNNIIDTLSKHQNEICEKLSFNLPDIYIPYLILINRKYTLAIKNNNNDNNKIFELSYDKNIGLMID